ncbi:MAG: family 10 glycosylhydrolase [Ignavibacteriaceae bacterium]|nr:family 10 glycosylhydrolase [Ignavibacteriaceae bacterium]
MTKKIQLSLFVSLSLLFLYGCAPYEYTGKREMRGVWIATVANIDWPASRNQTTEQKINDLKQELDKLKDAGINAVFFQVRTECDALYESDYEPWSYWLTGKQGEAPSPYFDPLKIVIEEAHKRGMELHAWLNPYRAVKKVGDYPASPDHIAVTFPSWILTFNDYKMLDPGLPAVRNYIKLVVGDIVRKYDVDGIHFDDYFYPYSPKVSSEDSLTYALYNNGINNVDDWRRYNINTMIAQVNDTIKQVKPWIKFGVSPFGIVENKYAGTSGFNSYSILYCDPLTWIKDKTVDYIVPQLYWEMEHEKAPYSKLLPWWASVSGDVHLYVGLYSSRLASPRYEKEKDEIDRQIKLNRETANVSGHIFFSSKSITSNAFKDFSVRLKNELHSHPALPPVMAWQNFVVPAAPLKMNAVYSGGKVKLTWEQTDKKDVSGYIIYRFSADEEINLNNSSKIVGVIPGADSAEYTEDLKGATGEFNYIISAYNRLYQESKKGLSLKIKISG